MLLELIFSWLLLLHFLACGIILHLVRKLINAIYLVVINFIFISEFLAFIFELDTSYLKKKKKSYLPIVCGL